MTVHGRTCWTVVATTGLPVTEIEQFLHWQRAIGRSADTVRSYARHLSLYYRWLMARAIDWDAITFDRLCDFVGVLSVGLPPLVPRDGGGRAASTVKAVNAAVREFYEFHRVEGRGPADLVLTRNPSRLPRHSHSFLAHIEARHPSDVPRLARAGRPATETVYVIDFDTAFGRLLAAASTDRDRPQPPTGRTSSTTKHRKSGTPEPPARHSRAAPGIDRTCQCRPAQLMMPCSMQRGHPN